MQQYASNKRKIFHYKRFKQKRRLSQEEKENRLRQTIRHSKEMYELKKQILKRDVYTCGLCGCKNEKNGDKVIRFHVHHIIKLSNDISKALDKDNLITLCSNCHNSINGKEELYEEYFKYLIDVKNNKNIIIEEKEEKYEIYGIN